MIPFNLPPETVLLRPMGGPAKRGIASTKAVVAGETLFTFIPRITVLEATADTHDNRANSCAYCTTPGCLPALRFDPKLVLSPVHRQKYVNHTAPVDGRMVQCGQCQQAVYCSVPCMIRDWEGTHAFECVYLRAWGSTCTTTELVVLRMYALALEEPLFRAQLEDLTSHAELILSGKGLAGLQAEAEEIDARMGAHYPPLATLSFKHLACLSFVNSTVMQNTYMEDNGQMFDPVFALLNHSCAPNVGVVFDGRAVALKALMPIKSGSELTVNYCVVGLPTVLRQKDLQDRFFFRCECRRCSCPTDRFLALCCPRCGKEVGGFQLEVQERQGNSRRADLTEGVVVAASATCGGCSVLLGLAVEQATALLGRLFEIWLEVLGGWSSAELSMVDYLASKDFGSCLAFPSSEAVRRCEDAILQIKINGMIPLYAFPLPPLLAGIAAHHAQRHAQLLFPQSGPRRMTLLGLQTECLDEGAGETSSVEALVNATVAVTFNADIPCNVAVYKLGLGNQLRDVAMVLCAHLAYTSDSLREEYLKASFALAMEAYRYLCQDYSESALAVVATRGLLCELQERMTHAQHNPNEALRWWCAHGTTDEGLRAEVGLFLQRCGVPFNKGRLRFSNRTFESLFTPLAVPVSTRRTSP